MAVVFCLVTLAIISIFFSTKNSKFTSSDVKASPSGAKKEIKISVIVPVYKVEKYLDECVKSILDQTLKEFEAIFVDDGSPDNCGKMLDEYAKKDERIKVIHQKNSGVSSARNRGIDEAKGEYLHFVDSDDTIAKETLKICYDKAVHHNAEILLYEQSKNETLEAPVFNMLTPSSCMGIYRRDLINKNNIRFIEGIRCCEDQGFNLLAFPKASKIVTTKDHFYNYRRDNPNSCCHNPNVDEDYKCFGKVAKNVYEVWKKDGYFRENKAKIAFLSWFACSMNYWTISNDVCRHLLSAIGPELQEDDVINLLEKDTKITIKKIIENSKK